MVNYTYINDIRYILYIWYKMDKIKLWVICLCPAVAWFAGRVIVNVNVTKMYYNVYQYCNDPYHAYNLHKCGGLI